MAPPPARRPLPQHRGDRVIAALGSGAVVAGMGWLLLWGLDVPRAAPVQRALALLDLRPPPPPPPPRREPPVEQPRRSPAREKPAPRNRKATPTEVVVPPVVIPPPKPPPIVAAPVPGRGAAASAGASTLPGPGTGAGGSGDGRGGGGDGEGGDTAPEYIRGRLRFSDLPPELRRPGFHATVGVRYRVETDGRVSGCEISRSSGMPALDRVTCDRIEERFRYRPSLDGDGRPVRSIIEENHEWVIDRSMDPER